MLPAYRTGQTVLVSNTRKFDVGDVVIVFAEGKEMLKRIVQHENGQVFVLGDNQDQSRDSRHYGWINDRHVVAKVIWPRKNRAL